MTQGVSYSVSVKEHGRMNLPKDLRAGLGLEEGDELVFILLEDGRAEVVPQRLIAKRGMGLFANLKQANNETDLFIAERRAEADT